jgi:hypothetical protein
MVRTEEARASREREAGNMSEEVNDAVRSHSEAPAEGGESATPENVRVHSEEPAEGSDDDAGDGGS